MFKLVIATEFENLPGFTTPNYVLMHMHPLLVCSLLRGDQNPERWSSSLQLSSRCRSSCEIPLLHGMVQGVWRTSCCPELILLWVVKSRWVSSLTCLTQTAPTWDVSLLVAPAIEILVQGKLLRCPNGKYFKFLGP